MRASFTGCNIRPKPPAAASLAVQWLGLGMVGGANDQRGGDHRSTAYGACIGNQFAADFGARNFGFGLIRWMTRSQS
jgi:hypothetical protein